MSFLAPLFLLGALAVAGPVIFHLIRRTTREQAPFSTLMFLKPSPPRLTRKSRIEHWLLLLLRSAVVVLLALAFARPFFRQAAAEATSPDAAKHRVVLVDTSASMRRDGLWDAARGRLAAELRAALPGDRVAVFAFDRAVTPVMTFDDWQALPPGDRAAQVLGRLGDVTPSWAGTQLGQALLRAAEELAGLDAPDAAREIVLISDVQEGGRLEALQAFDWPRGVVLRVESLKAPAGGNAGLQIVADAADTARTAAPAVRVRVVNSPDARSEQLQVAWAALDGRPAGPPVDVYVPPGQARIVSLPVPTNGPAPDRVVLSGDTAPFDNTAFVVPPQPAEAVVAYLGAEAAEDAGEPLFFLRRALTPTARQRLSVVQPGPADPLPAGAALWVVTGNLPGATAAELRAHLQDG
ncbi:MAG: BatA domain-containing protein, partial [Limisphaerales bacterium]